MSDFREKHPFVPSVSPPRVRNDELLAAEERRRAPHAIEADLALEEQPSFFVRVEPQHSGGRVVLPPTLPLGEVAPGVTAVLHFAAVLEGGWTVRQTSQGEHVRIVFCSADEPLHDEFLVVRRDPTPMPPIPISAIALIEVERQPG